MDLASSTKDAKIRLWKERRSWPLTCHHRTHGAHQNFNDFHYAVDEGGEQKATKVWIM